MQEGVLIEYVPPVSDWEDVEKTETQDHSHLTVTETAEVTEVTSEVPEVPEETTESEAEKKTE